MLASCAKTTVVYNETPEEIGFKAVTGVMTKTVEDGATMLEPMGVFANYYADGDVGESYFENESFAQDGETTTWVGGQYWPVTGTLIFTLYAPYNNTPNVVSYDEVNNKLTINADNSNIASQKDWLYGKTQPTGTKADNDDAISISFAHALSKIVVNVKGDNVVKVKKIELLNTLQTAEGTITYSDTNDDDINEGALAWKTSGNGVIKTESMVLFENNEGAVLSETNLSDVKTCLVTPIALTKNGMDGAEAIRLTYKLGQNGNDLVYTTGVKPNGDEITDSNQLGTEWKAGSKYTYNITVGAKEIKFTPSVDPWDGDDDDEAEGDNQQDVEVTPNNSAENNTPAA